MRQQAALVTTSVTTGRQQQVARWFYINVALLMILLNVVAFGPSILNSSGRRVPLPFTPLITAHAIVAFAWLLLFLTQATLIATRRVAVHRRLGVIGAALAVVFLVLGYFSVVEQARRGFDLSGDLIRVPPPPGVAPVVATVGLLFFFFDFAVLVGAGLYYRHRPSIHKRLMLLAMLGGLTPTPVAHVIGHWSVLQPWAIVILPGSFLVFVSLSAIYDRISEGRIHPVSLWVPILWFAWRVFDFRVIQPSTTWHHFAAWLIR
jgi:hypothetical protein